MAFKLFNANTPNGSIIGVDGDLRLFQFGDDWVIVHVDDIEPHLEISGVGRLNATGYSYNGELAFESPDGSAFNSVLHGFIYRPGAKPQEPYLYELDKEKFGDEWYEGDTFPTLEHAEQQLAPSGTLDEDGAPLTATLKWPRLQLSRAGTGPCGTYSPEDDCELPEMSVGCPKYAFSIPMTLGEELIEHADRLFVPASGQGGFTWRKNLPEVFYPAAPEADYWYECAEKPTPETDGELQPFRYNEDGVKVPAADVGTESLTFQSYVLPLRKASCWQFDLEAWR